MRPNLFLNTTRSLALILFLLIGLFPNEGKAQAPYLVKDINTQPAGSNSNPEQFVQIGLTPSLWQRRKPTVQSSGKQTAPRGEQLW